MTVVAAASPRNKLLRALPAEDLHRIRSLLQPFPLKPRRIVHHARLPIEHVYFVERGLISVIAHTDEEHAIEAWIIGCEGIAGVPVVLGAETSPHCRMVQGEGLALRMRAMDLRLAMDELPALRAVLLRYVNSVLVQVGQSGACNAQHSIQQRLARWLLMAHDRLKRDDLPLTHDVLSKMIGVRRASVTQMLQVLSRSGAIQAERGVVRVLDQVKLEHLACGCYRTMKVEFDRLAIPLSAAGELPSSAVVVAPSCTITARSSSEAFTSASAAERTET